MNIFVGNLSFSATNEDVKKVFESFGAVDAVKIKNKSGKNSRGFGFVSMPDEAQAKAAIVVLEGKEFMGRPMRVSPERPKIGRPRKDYKAIKQQRREAKADTLTARLTAKMDKEVQPSASPEKSERPERSQRPARFDRPQRTERSDRPQRSERPQRPERSQRPERTERSGRSERSSRPERPARSEGPVRSEKSDKEFKPRKTTEKVFKKPGKSSGVWEKRKGTGVAKPWKKTPGGIKKKFKYAR